MENRYERWPQLRSASHRGDVRARATRKRHWPRNYVECRNLTGLGFPCDGKNSAIRKNRSRLLRKNPRMRHPRNGLAYTTPATKGYERSVSKRIPEGNYRRIARPSTPLAEVTASLDCSDGLTRDQRGSPRLGG